MRRPVISRCPWGFIFETSTAFLWKRKSLAVLLKRIPEGLANDPEIVHMKDIVKRKQATAIGCKFVDFTIRYPEGKTAKLSEYAGNGKVVLVDFWASWCAPCCSAIPGLIKIYEQYKDKGFEIVAVPLDQDAKAWKEAIRKMNMSWPQLTDLKAWKSEGVKSYAVGTIPYTILIDAGGKIIARNLHGDGVGKGNCRVGEIIVFFLNSRYNNIFNTMIRVIFNSIICLPLFLSMFRTYQLINFPDR